MEQNQDMCYGKMCRVHSPQTKGRTSFRSSKKSVKLKDIKLMMLDIANGKRPDLSWQMISASHGGYLMLSTGEFPREEDASTLSVILMEKVPEKYYLSPKACQGILSRAKNRGKKLPDILEQALLMQSASV